MHYGELKSTEISETTDRVVILPLGALEQHGWHLPVLTDTMNLEEIVRRAEAELGDTAIFLPTLWAGASDHHLGFPGAISFGNDTYMLMLIDVLESLIGSGYRRILLLNGHGGNRVPAQMALYEVMVRHREMHDLWLATTAWFDLTAQQVADMPELTQKRVRHACEVETSMILHLRPDLVQLDQAQGAKVPFESAFYSPDGERPGKVLVLRPLDHISASGAFGRPELATAEKGARLFDIAVEQVAACVRDMATWQAFEPG
jgi:creatinine amidohydrolase